MPNAIFLFAFITFPIKECVLATSIPIPLLELSLILVPIFIIPESNTSSQILFIEFPLILIPLISINQHHFALLRETIIPLAFKQERSIITICAEQQSIAITNAFQTLPIVYTRQEISPSMPFFHSFKLFSLDSVIQILPFSQSLNKQSILLNYISKLLLPVMPDHSNQLIKLGFFKLVVQWQHHLLLRLLFFNLPLIYLKLRWLDILEELCGLRDKNFNVQFIDKAMLNKANNLLFHQFMAQQLVNVYPFNRLLLKQQFQKGSHYLTDCMILSEFKARQS
ncbi:hypothetical protein FGO68_gene3956 [Halteria grandinella]|uniref:Uncharacterized protein n=1 Tax=Halteria grandinella TaxID=5974 RepID=A0A8J8N9F2_HALGN|nr:hypothetical protein FGO68_gene3956 [Halteria grandinella]